MTIYKPRRVASEGNNPVDILILDFWLSKS